LTAADLRVPTDVGVQPSVHPKPMSRLCRLDALAGQERVCNESRCAFWQPGGAVLEGRCVFEQVDLAGRAALVSELRGLRDVLEAGASDAERTAAEHRYHHLLNDSAEE
jgi:hypothetical protein